MSRRRLAVLLVPAAAVAAVLVVALWPKTNHQVAARMPDLAAGRRVYRQSCGKCHDLAAALSAGFGGKSALYGGPSFNNLRVSYSLSTAAIKGAFTGHEAINLSWQQIQDVSAYIARVTRHNPVVARLTDG